MASGFSLLSPKKGKRYKPSGRQRDALLELLPLPFIVIDESGHLSAEEKAQKIFALAPGAEINDLVAKVETSRQEEFRSQLLLFMREKRGFNASFFVSATRTHVRLTGAVKESPKKPLFVLWVEDITATTLTSAQLTLEIAAQNNKTAQTLSGLSSFKFPVWRRNATGELTWCNKAYADAVETSVEEALREQLNLASNVVDRSHRSLTERVLASGQSITQTKHVVINGNRRLLEFTETPIGEGNTIGFALDMTPVEEARSELERYIASHAEVLETLTTGVAVFGSDQKVKFHNSAFCTLWGLEESWLSTQPTLSELLENMRERRQLPEQADFRRFKQGWLQLFTSLIESHQELLYKPDGKAIRLVIVPHPMGGLLFTFEDVSSRLALESSYNTLIAVQRETLNNLAEGIAVFGEDGRLDLWNPALQRMWSLTEFDLEARPHISELTDKITRYFDNNEEGIDLKALMISNAVDRVPRNGRMERVDESVLEYHSVLLPDGGILNSFLDVTDSVRVEQALRERNAALVAADQLKLDFLANVSYQLRTPLNAMIGFAEILIKQYFGPLNEKQIEYARGTLEAGERLVMLVDAILDLSTIEAGYMRLHTAPTEVYEMMADILSLAEDWATKQDVRLVLDCPRNLATIEADERRLKQVLLNLVSNALKFTPAGGKITMSAQKAKRQNVECVALSVSDTGSGIPSIDQARVFEPFEHGHHRKFSSGAGVGLALVKSFVTLHGGHVDLNSSPDGTIVTCYLPVKQTVEAESVA